MWRDIEYNSTTSHVIFLLYKSSTNSFFYFKRDPIWCSWADKENCRRLLIYLLLFGLHIRVWSWDFLFTTVRLTMVLPVMSSQIRTATRTQWTTQPNITHGDLAPTQPQQSTQLNALAAVMLTGWRASTACTALTLSDFNVWSSV